MLEFRNKELERKNLLPKVKQLDLSDPEVLFRKRSDRTATIITSMGQTNCSPKNSVDQVSESNQTGGSRFESNISSNRNLCDEKKKLTDGLARRL